MEALILVAALGRADDVCADRCDEGIEPVPPQGPLGKMLQWIPIVRPRCALILCGEAYAREAKKHVTSG